MNLRELNYILIPKASASWERWEASRTRRIVQPLVDVLGSPTTEGQVVFVAMLVAGAAGIDVRYSNLYLVFSGLFGLLVAAGVLRPLARITADELDIRVEHPARVVAGERLVFTLVLRNTGRRALHALRVTGPFLPWDGSYEGPRSSLASLPAGAEARLTVTARFLMRGVHSLGPFGVASIRPLGLVRGNRRLSPPVRFTVLPNVHPVADMPLPPWHHDPGSVARGGRAGESFELLGVRPYRAGDRPRDLHARAWARHGIPIVRELRQDVMRRAGVILDLTGWTESPPARDVVDGAIAVAGGLVSWLAAHEVVVDLCVLGTRPATVTVGGWAAPPDAAWELLAVVESGRPPEADPALVDPAQFPVNRWAPPRGHRRAPSPAGRSRAVPREPLGRLLRGRGRCRQPVARSAPRAPAPPGGAHEPGHHGDRAPVALGSRYLETPDPRTDRRRAAARRPSDRRRAAA